MITSDSATLLSQNWKELRQKARQRWTSLSKDDLDTVNGNMDVLVDLLREKYGYTQLLAEDEVSRFLSEATTASAPQNG